MIGCRFSRLKDSLLCVLFVRAWVIGKKECYFVNSFLSLNVLQNFTVFFHKVLEYRLEKGHALMLAQISEVLKVFAQGRRVVVFDTNIDEIILTKERVKR